MSALDKALETENTYTLTNEECFALLGAIEYRIRFLKGVIESEVNINIDMAKAAEADKNHLERILEKLGF